MIPITITEFVKQTVETNPDTDAKTLITSCKEALKAKTLRFCLHDLQLTNLGGRLGNYRDLSYMCFTCMTGEMDDSEDYEIE